jgi:hypothetical protein
MDLDWFWRNWIFTTARLDQGVDTVERGEGGTRIVLSNRGTMVMPLEMEVTFEGGTSDRVKLPVEMWNLGDRFTYRVRDGRAVTAVVIDPRRILPDTDRSNNVWRR